MGHLTQTTPTWRYLCHAKVNNLIWSTYVQIYKDSSFNCAKDVKKMQNVKRDDFRWLGVIQGHRQCHHLIQRMQLPIHLSQKLFVLYHFQDTVFCTQLVSSPTPPHNRFVALFRGPPGWAGARRELLDFTVQGKINWGRHTDYPDGRHSIRTNQCPPPPFPIFYRPDALPAAQPTVSKHWRQTSPTHTAGNILELVITHRGDRVSDVKVGSLVSDHHLIMFKLVVKRPCLNSELVPCRQWRKLSLPVSEADLCASRLLNLPAS